MRRYIVLLTKSPEPLEGRSGVREEQNWYQTCQCAVAEFKQSSEERPTTILVPTKIQLAGCRSEAEIYTEALTELGLKKDVDFQIVDVGWETIGQVEYGLSLISVDSQVLFISTILHAPRVWWLCNRHKTTHVIEQIVVTDGFPRWKEAVTDIVLAIIFPLIDLLGYRRKFQNWTIVRRESGQL